MNRSTRGQWAMYASHRQRIERLLIPARRGGRICVLGAGNCNDLDLDWLTQVYEQIHLIDLDADALAEGVRRQKVERAERIGQHAPVDLTGIADRIAAWRENKPTDVQIDECLQAISNHQSAIINSSSLVLSPCVLSQLIISVRDAIGSEHPRYPELRAAIRARHLRTMIDVLAPGGTGVLVIDLASTENFPDLARVAEDRAGDLMRALVTNGKCFRALAPAAIAAAMRENPHITDIQFAPPWIWHLGLKKSFLVYAVTFRRFPMSPKRE